MCYFWTYRDVEDKKLVTDAGGSGHTSQRSQSHPDITIFAVEWEGVDEMVRGRLR